MQRFIPIIPFIFVLLWSTGFVGAKYVLPYSEPFTILALRMVLTLAAFGVLLAIWHRRPTFTAISAQHMLVGILIHGFYLGGVFFAIDKGLSAGVAALIVGLQPILTAGVLGLFLGQRLSKRIWFGLILGFFGVALVIYGRDTDLAAPAPAIAFIAAIVALFGIVAGTVLQKRWGLGGHLLTASFWQYVGALIFFTIASFGFESQMITWTPALIAGLLWLVFGLSVAAILLLLVMIEHGEIARVSSYFYLVPPVVLIEAYFLFGERLSGLSLVGAFIIVIAIMAVNRRN